MTASSDKSVGQVEFPIRLGRFLAMCGVGPRRGCAELVKAGKALVNGAAVVDPWRFVDKGDVVTVEGKKVSPPEFAYVMLNKPVGYACTNVDPKQRRLAIELINLPGHRLYSAGRLDKDSEGLIIFTDDGDYAHRLTHPRNEVWKSYHVTISRPLTVKETRMALDGITDDGEFLKPVGIRCLSGNTYLFIMGEGKKREIRRIVMALGARVHSLRRVGVGALRLGELPTGAWRHLTVKEIQASLSPRRAADAAVQEAPCSNRPKKQWPPIRHSTSRIPR